MFDLDQSRAGLYVISDETFIKDKMGETVTDLNFITSITGNFMFKVTTLQF